MDQRTRRLIGDVDREMVDDQYSVHKSSMAEVSKYLKTLVDQYDGSFRLKTGSGHIFDDLVRALPDLPHYEQQKIALCHRITDIVYPLASRLYAQAVSLKINISTAKISMPTSVEALATYVAFDAAGTDYYHCFLSPLHSRSKSDNISIPSGISVLCEPFNYQYHQVKGEVELDPYDPGSGLPNQDWSNRSKDIPGDVLAPFMSQNLPRAHPEDIRHMRINTRMTEEESKLKWLLEESLIVLGAQVIAENKLRSDNEVLAINALRVQNKKNENTKNHENEEHERSSLPELASEGLVAKEIHTVGTLIAKNKKTSAVPISNVSTLENKEPLLEQNSQTIQTRSSEITNNKPSKNSSSVTKEEVQPLKVKEDISTEIVDKQPYQKNAQTLGDGAPDMKPVSLLQQAVVEQLNPVDQKPGSEETSLSANMPVQASSQSVQDTPSGLVPVSSGGKSSTQKSVQQPSSFATKEGDRRLSQAEKGQTDTNNYTALSEDTIPSNDQEDEKDQQTSGSEHESVPSEIIANVLMNKSAKRAFDDIERENKKTLKSQGEEAIRRDDLNPIIHQAASKKTELTSEDRKQPPSSRSEEKNTSKNTVQASMIASEQLPEQMVDEKNASIRSPNADNALRNEVNPPRSYVNPKTAGVVLSDAKEITPLSAQAESRLTSNPNPSANKPSGANSSNVSDDKESSTLVRNVIPAQEISSGIKSPTAQNISSQSGNSTNKRVVNKAEPSNVSSVTSTPTLNTKKNNFVSSGTTDAPFDAKNEIPTRPDQVNSLQSKVTSEMTTHRMTHPSDYAVPDKLYQNATAYFSRDADTIIYNPQHPDEYSNLEKKNFVANADSSLSNIRMKFNNLSLRQERSDHTLQTPAISEAHNNTLAQKVTGAESYLNKAIPWASKYLHHVLRNKSTTHSELVMKSETKTAVSHGESAANSKIDNKDHLVRHLSSPSLGGQDKT